MSEPWSMKEKLGISTLYGLGTFLGVGALASEHTNNPTKSITASLAAGFIVAASPWIAQKISQNKTAKKICLSVFSAASAGGLAACSEGESAGIIVGTIAGIIPWIPGVMDNDEEKPLPPLL